MPNLPDITPADIEKAIPEVSAVERIGEGGQKDVFRVQIDKKAFALKIALVPTQADDEEGSTAADSSAEIIAARAEREVETMRDCPSAHMVKLGPIGLRTTKIGDKSIVYFTEEFVDGEDLRTIIGRGPLSPEQVVTIGLQITDAIKALWDLGKIHRDIKPGNIMRRSTTGEYVLLDAGLAFDIAGDSLSRGYLVGTPAYFSPEQIDYSSRRSGLDFRSDMFSLGVVMYEAATGTHPFTVVGATSSAIFAKILDHDPPAPSTLIKGGSFPASLDEVILRMLGKSPHLRFRTCDRLIEALGKVK